MTPDFENKSKPPQRCLSPISSMHNSFQKWRLDGQHGPWRFPDDDTHDQNVPPFSPMAPHKRIQSQFHAAAASAAQHPRNDSSTSATPEVDHNDSAFPPTSSPVVASSSAHLVDSIAQQTGLNTPNRSQTLYQRPGKKAEAHSRLPVEKGSVQAKLKIPLHILRDVLRSTDEQGKHGQDSNSAVSLESQRTVEVCLSGLILDFKIDD